MSHRQNVTGYDQNALRQNTILEKCYRTKRNSERPLWQIIKGQNAGENSTWTGLKSKFPILTKCQWLSLPGMSQVWMTHRKLWKALYEFWKAHQNFWKTLPKSFKSHGKNLNNSTLKIGKGTLKIWRGERKIWKSTLKIEKSPDLSNCSTLCGTYPILWHTFFRSIILKSWCHVN